MLYWEIEGETCSVKVGKRKRDECKFICTLGILMQRGKLNLLESIWKSHAK